MITPSEYQARRQTVLDYLGADAIAILAAAPEVIRNGDAHYPYRQNSYFYYLTGFTEPEAILVLIPGRAPGETLLFNRPRDPKQEQWNGRRLGQAGACHELGISQAFPIHSFAEHLPTLLKGRSQLHFAMGHNLSFDQQLMSAAHQVNAHLRASEYGPSQFINLEPFLAALRLHKSPAELTLMRQAADISAEAHINAMKICRPGLFEYQLEAEFLATFKRHGCIGPAYETIVGSGGNGCILHYRENQAELKAGELVLIDAGAEYHYYAADITRTFPVNGRFSAEQRAIYQLVLKAQLAGIAKVKPGNHWQQPQQTIIQIITAGLVELGLLVGQVDKLIAEKAYLKFYMHNASHWLGLDTHDAGPYHSASGAWQTLEPGMVLTIEPGIYISANTPGVDAKWWDIGIRIEDDVLVTPTGCEVLTAKVPKNCDAIEALMAGSADAL